jgi:hypothetical protein
MADDQIVDTKIEALTGQVDQIVDANTEALT